MDVKMFKLKEDPCYGKKYELIEQCKRCWIKNACSTAYKNRN
ncbi:MAG: hypothetical protein V1837_05185 [Candidatus Woesearchaeota archaeon]